MLFFVQKPIQRLHISLPVKAQALIMVYETQADLAFYLASLPISFPLLQPL